MRKPLVLVALLAGLSCASEKSNSLPPEAASAASVTAVETPSAADFERAAESEKLVLQAEAFEARGVLDRAADAWKRSHAVVGDAEKLHRAARLYAECGDQVSARVAFEGLAQYQGYGQIAAMGVAQAHSGRPDESRGASIRLADKARAELDANHAGRALSMLLAHEDELDVNGYSLLGTLSWARGKQVAAQRAWAKARCHGADPSLYSMRVVPSFEGAAQDFALDDERLLFATASGALFTYYPLLGHFGWSGRGIHDLDAPFAYESPHGVAQVWTFPRAAVPVEYGKRLRAIAAPSDPYLLWHNDQGKLHLLQMSEGGRPTLLWSKDVGASPIGLSFSHDSERVFVGGGDGQISVYDRVGTRRAHWRAHRGLVRELAVSADGKWLSSWETDADHVVIWDVVSRQERARVQIEQEVRQLSFFPDSETLEVRLPLNLNRYDWSSGELESSQYKPLELVRVEHSDRRGWTALGLTEQAAIGMFRSRDDHVVRRIDNGLTRTMHAASSHNGKRLAVATSAGTRLFQLDGWSSVVLTADPSRQVAFSPDGNRVAVALDDSIEIFDVETRIKRHSIVETLGADGALRFARDDSLLVSSTGKTVVYWLEPLPQLHADDAALVVPLQGGALRRVANEWALSDRKGAVERTLVAGLHALELNASRTHLVVVAGDVLTVRNVSGTQTRSFPLGANVEKLALSADARHVAVYSNPATLQLLDVESGTWRRVGAGDHRGEGGLQSLFFIGNDTLLAAGADGLLAYRVDTPEWRGGLHVLRDGDWFSVVQQPSSTFVDGSARGINGCALSPFTHSPGLVWESLRRAGSFAELVRGELSSSVE